MNNILTDKYNGKTIKIIPIINNKSGSIFDSCTKAKWDTINAKLQNYKHKSSSVDIYKNGDLEMYHDHDSDNNKYVKIITTDIMIIDKYIVHIYDCVNIDNDEFPIKKDYDLIRTDKIKSYTLNSVLIELIESSDEHNYLHMMIKYDHNIHTNESLTKILNLIR